MNFFNFRPFKKEPKAPWSKYYPEGTMNLHIQDMSLYNYLEDIGSVLNAQNNC